MKRKGSALVFSVLILSFFLAISLNIFFLARKKSEKAGIKVSGERITNNIDLASSLGYQELLMAEKLVGEGVLYDDNHPAILGGGFNNSSYTDIDIDVDRNELYVNPTTGSYGSSSYAGIQITHFIDYFSSQWDYSLTDNRQKLIMGEKVEGKKLSRMWQSAGIPNKTIPLWSPSATSDSIGGYTLATNKIPNTDTSDTPFTATYEKNIRLNKLVSGPGTEAVFRIRVTESFIYSKNGTNISFYGRSLESFVIEALDNR